MKQKRIVKKRRSAAAQPRTLASMGLKLRIVRTYKASP